jgi:Rha family phage regulatory protein
MEITKQTNIGIPAISSLEIAKITGKNHQHVLRDIKSILVEAEIGESSFGHSYKSAQGKQLRCFLLPKREFNLVISGYSVKHRLKLIDRLEELEAKQAAPILTEKQELLRRLIAISTTEEHAAFVTMIAPSNNYGSEAANGKFRHGIRRACFVASKSRDIDAKTLFLQRQALSVLEQLFLPI